MTEALTNILTPSASASINEAKSMNKSATSETRGLSLLVFWDIKPTVFLFLTVGQTKQAK